MNTPIKQEVYLSTDNGGMTVSRSGYDTYDIVEEQDGYFFNTEQLNELLSNVIKDALDTAAESKFISELGKGQVVHSKNAKESISSTFEQTFQKYKL